MKVKQPCCTLQWPITTRAQRIDELQQIAPSYHKPIQKDNVAAAIDWHRRFNCDDVVPTDTVLFQGERKTEMSDLRWEGQ